MKKATDCTSSSHGRGRQIPMLVFHIDMNFASYREDYLYKWLRIVKKMGYTAILWELEDKIKWTACRECVDKEAISKEKFREILDYAESLGLENIPLLQTIGHAEYVLKHERYRQWREDPRWHDCYCTSNPEVRSFLKAWIREYLDLFGDRTRQFHLGGDEAYRFASCSICRKRVDEIGLNAFYAEHLIELSEELRTRGIVPCIWGDMMLAHPRQIHSIPKYFRVWDWNYWDGVDEPRKTIVWGKGNLDVQSLSPEILKDIPELVDDHGKMRNFHSALFLHRNGWEVVLCGSTRSAGDSYFIGSHSVHAKNVVGVAQMVRNEGFYGCCITSWGIRIHPWEVQLPSLELATKAWNQPDSEFVALESEVVRKFLGICYPSIIERIGIALPMFRRHESGIQYNRLKDPVPAPPTYISEQIREWRACPKKWSGLQQEIENGKQRLSETRRELEEIFNRNETMPIYQSALDQSLRMQIYALGIGDAVINGYSNPDLLSKGILMAQEAKVAMEEWSSSWLTPNFSVLLSKLIFSGMENFLKNRKSDTEGLLIHK